MVRKTDAADSALRQYDEDGRSAAWRESAMTTKHGTMDREASGRTGQRFNNSEAGLTLVEVVGIVVILMILTTIGVAQFQNQREKAKLVRCMAEIRGIQAAVMNMGDGRYIPDPEQFWESAWPDGRRHGPYYYIVDGDPNSGHGNDLDGVDEENPGASDPDKKDIKFVIFCDHDHGELAKYVYLTDEEAPTVATDDNDPDWQRFLKWEYGGPGAGNHGKSSK
jgi:hypothetical protein